jgi:hypothetical protein
MKLDKYHHLKHLLKDDGDLVRFRELPGETKFQVKTITTNCCEQRIERKGAKSIGAIILALESTILNEKGARSTSAKEPLS